MASSYRTGGSAHDAGDPFFYTRAGAVPIEVTEQREFRVRCDKDPRLWRARRFMPPGCSVDTLINQRTSFSQYVDYCPPHWQLDVLYARNSGEYHYADMLAQVVNGREWLQERSYFDSRLLLFGRSMIADTGSVPSDDDVNKYMPYTWRRWERAGRNRHGVFLAVQHREVLAMKPVVVRSKYPALPSDWVRFEVPYGFNPQCPPILTYYGLELAWNPLGGTYTSDFWKILFTEHAWLSAVELIHEARRGRLWWLPEDLLNGMEQIGLSAICGDNRFHTSELEALVNEIRLIRWSKVPRSNGIVPPWNKYSTPVFDSGDFVDFDPENWCSWLKPEMYMPHDDNNLPLGPVDDRGEPQFGRLNCRVANPVPDADIYLHDSTEVAVEPSDGGDVPVGSTRTASQAGLADEPSVAPPLRMSQDTVDEISRFEELDISSLDAVIDREPESSLLPSEEAEAWLARGPTPRLEVPPEAPRTDRRNYNWQRPRRLLMEAHLVDVSSGRARVVRRSSLSDLALASRVTTPRVAIASRSTCTWLTAPPLPAPAIRRPSLHYRLQSMDVIDVDNIDDSSN